MGTWTIQYRNPGGPNNTLSYSGTAANTPYIASGFGSANGCSLGNVSGNTAIFANGKGFINACNCNSSGVVASITSSSYVGNSGYDCVNGGCYSAGNYDTPGSYTTLANCQANCGATCTTGSVCVDPNNYCPNGQTCLPTTEFSQIQSLSSQLRQRDCSG
jgi:hypothetical protein